jgi:HSP20 family protein
MAEKTVPVPRGPERNKSGREITRARERNLRPPVDIYETSEGLVLMADLPGVTKEGLQVHVDGDLLTISGKASHAVPGDVIYREYELANFYRQFELNEEIDREKIGAELKHGVLVLHLPKAEKAKPKQIEVRVG